MGTITLPIGSIGSDSQYRAESGSYPLSNCIGKDSTNNTYAGVNWTTGANSDTILYLDFDTSSVPLNVTIKSVTAKVKIYGSSTGQSRSDVRTIQFFSGSTPKGSAVDFTLLSATIYEITNSGSWTRSELENTRIKLYILRNSSNTTSSTYVYVMGADITIEYDDAPAVKHTLTINKNNYNVSPSEGGEYAEGQSVPIIITADQLPKITLDGSDITNLFINAPEYGDVIVSPAASTYLGIQSGVNNIGGAIGQSAESPSSNTSVWYGSNTTEVDMCYAEYTFDFSGVPSDATNILIACKVAGKAESATYTHSKGGRYSVWGLCCNGTAKGELIHATSTSVQVLEFENTGEWTRAELDGLQLRHYVGYYGGTTNGVTITVSFTVSHEGQYTYNLVMDLDHVLVFGAEGGPVLFVKDNGTFKEVLKVYRKDNGQWVEVVNIQDLFLNASNNTWSGYFKDI